MGEFRNKVGGLLDKFGINYNLPPIASLYKNDKFVCELQSKDDYVDGAKPSRRETLEFIQHCKDRYPNEWEAGEEKFFEDLVVGCDGYFGYVPVRLMTPKFIISVFERSENAPGLLPDRYIMGSKEVIQYVVDHKDERRMKGEYLWLVNNGYVKQQA